MSNITIACAIRIIDSTDFKSLGNESVKLYLDSIHKDTLAPPHPAWRETRNAGDGRYGNNNVVV